MLGHKNVATTQEYLGVNYANVREAVEQMAFGRKITEVGKSDVKSASTETLLTELEQRGVSIKDAQHAI